MTGVDLTGGINSARLQESFFPKHNQTDKITGETTNDKVQG